MKRNNFVRIAFLVLASWTASTARAAVIEFEEDGSLPLVHLNVAVKAGAAHDPHGQSGLTNFFGEMLLRGTRTRTKAQIDLALDQMGAQLDVETRAESMILRGTVLSSQLDPFLQLLKEVLTEPAFPDVEIRKLKGEITAEILDELATDQALIGRAFPRHLFANHPYGNPIHGQQADVAKFTRAAIATHFDRILRDELLVIVGSGEASSGRIESWARDLAQTRARALAGSKVVPATTVPMPTPATKRTLTIIDKPARNQTQIAFGQIGVRMTDPSYYPLFVGNQAFGGGSFSSRLMQEVRVKRGWAYGAGSYFRAGIRPRSWQATTFPAAKDTPDALTLMLQLTTALKERGISEEEFRFAQTSLVNNAGFNYNTPKKRVENALLERTLELPSGFMKEAGPQISRVTLAQVNETLAQYLRPDLLTIVVMGTAQDLKAPLAKAAEVDIKDVDVIPYTAE